ncbi:hypothetical protein J7L36_00900 [bacterium]|nr:hypothetical protein [bacterium]
MKIKEVQYQRLFTLGKYNNERIGFIAEVEENEDADEVLGQLFFKILDVEDCLEAYRRLLEEKDKMEYSINNVQHRIAYLSKQISEMKVTIHELVEKIQKGDIDAKLRHACETRSLKSLQQEKEKETKRLEELIREKKEIEKYIEILKQNIKKGEFKLPKGLELKKFENPIEVMDYV